MKVAVNGRPLHFPYVGTGVYLRNLLSNLSGLAAENIYDVVTNAPWTIEFTHDIINTVKTGNALEIASLKGQLYWEQMLFPAVSRHLKPDVVHVPYLGSSYIKICPQVVSVLDVIPYLLKEAAPNTPGLKTYFKLQAAALKRVERIITISEHSKSDIMRLLGVPAERIKITYLAPDAAFRVIEDQVGVLKLKKKYGLADQYLFYAGGTDRRKNIEVLLEAYAQLSLDIRQEFQLVLLGKMDSADSYHSNLLQRINSLSDGAGVLVIPRVSLEELALLYNTASVFVYPSKYEGFGLPPLEAMACGTPVVASSASSIPEVVGDAGLLFDPCSPEELASCLTKIITDSELAKSLTFKGLERSKTFTWQKTAEQTLDIYHEAVS